MKLYRNNALYTLFRLNKYQQDICIFPLVNESIQTHRKIKLKKFGGVMIGGLK